MGNRFSTDPNRAEILVRDKDGKLLLYKNTTDQSQACNPMPVGLNPIRSATDYEVSYLFLPSTGLHAHTYYDEECDTPGNDIIYPESSVGGKNLNYLQTTANSNSNFFLFNADIPNKPDHPSFFNGPTGTGEQRKTARKAFDRCTPMPFAIHPNKKVSFTHNNTPMSIFTDDKCTNEYIIPLDGMTNVDNRTVDNTLFDIAYTKITSYTDPAPASNAMYYRTYRDKYPDSSEDQQSIQAQKEKREKEEKERVERLEKERLEKERLDKLEKERERVERERVEKERADKLEKERVEREKLLEAQRKIQAEAQAIRNFWGFSR